MTRPAADLYEVGERVSLRIDLGRVTCLNGDTMVLATEATDEIVVNVADEQVTVTRVSPADGEPRAGELWRDAIGCLWFAVRDHKQIFLVGAEADVQHQGRTMVAWQNVHRGIAGPISRVWCDTTGPAMERTPDLSVMLANLPVEPATGPDEQDTAAPCPGDPHCRAGHRCPEHQADPLGLRDRLADHPDQP